MSSITRIVWTTVCLAWIALSASAEDSKDYNPLRIDPGAGKFETRDLTFTYGRSDREIPILAYLPNGDAKAPIVIFSHGLGGSRHGSAYLGKHWASRGYAAIFIQHPGSDSTVMEDVPLLKKRAALTKAANLKNTIHRFEDIPALIDQLEKWNQEDGHLFENRLDASKVGMSGHSYGAVTTQGVSGQQARLIKDKYREKRIQAALPMSPSPPRRGSPEEAFRSVSIPWLLMTGTEDGSPISDTYPSDRRKVFPALPSGNHYELTLWKAEHSAFTERRLPGDRLKRNPNHHKAILALSTAFWDAFLRQDTAARDWLDGEQARSVLEPKDSWLTK